MCQACDGPEVREQLDRLAEALDAGDLVARFSVHRFGTVSDDEAADTERWYDNSDHGNVTLTRGQYLIIRSALMRQMDDLVDDALGALDFSERVGVPLDSIADVETAKRLFEANLDAVEAVTGSRVTEVRVEIPDTVAALVGDE